MSRDIVAVINAMTTATPEMEVGFRAVLGDIRREVLYKAPEQWRPYWTALGVACANHFGPEPTNEWQRKVANILTDKSDQPATTPSETPEIIRDPDGFNYPAAFNKARQSPVYYEDMSRREIIKHACDAERELQQARAELEAFKNFVGEVRQFTEITVCRCGEKSKDTDLALYLARLDSAVAAMQKTENSKHEVRDE